MGRGERVKADTVLAASYLQSVRSPQVVLLKGLVPGIMNSHIGTVGKFEHSSDIGKGILL